MRFNHWVVGIEQFCAKKSLSLDFTYFILKTIFFKFYLLMAYCILYLQAV